MSGAAGGEKGSVESERDSGNPTGGPGADAPAPEGVQLVRAQALLGSRGMLRIEHRGEVYTLRITRNDRLILTK